MSRGLSVYERETIIDFNRARNTAAILTYEDTWQKHLEGEIGLRPLRDNGFCGRE